MSNRFNMALEINRECECDGVASDLNNNILVGPQEVVKFIGSSVHATTLE